MGGDDFRPSGHFTNAAPSDYWYLVYFIMFYLGVGNLFPWNAFITASSYFAQRFCGTSFESNFENFFSFAFTLSQTIGLALSVKYANQLSLKTKITRPLIAYSVIFAVTTVLVSQTVNPTLLFFITLISACLCGLTGALLSGGLFGLTASFPPTYTGALMNGQGLAGLVVSMANILTLLGTAPVDTCDDDAATDDGGCPENINYSALAYFIIATLILMSCVIAFVSLDKLPFAKYYIARANLEIVENTETSNPFISTVDHELSDSSSHRMLDHLPVNEGGGALKVNPAQKSHSLSDIYDIFSEIRIPSISVFFTFTVTIAVFPALIVFIVSTGSCRSSSRFSNDLFVPFMFLLFNLFDLCGRMTAGSTKAIFTPKNIWMPSLARLVFIPLFLFCNVAGSQLPVLFDSDVAPIIFMILFAFTNGYVATSCMMFGPSIVEPSMSPLAGNIMIFSLTLGLFMGACCSFLVVFISQGKLNF